MGEPAWPYHIIKKSHSHPPCCAQKHENEYNSQVAFFKRQDAVALPCKEQQPLQTLSVVDRLKSRHRYRKTTAVLVQPLGIKHKNKGKDWLD